MAKKVGNVVAIVTGLVKPITDELNLTLWDVRFEKEGAHWYLRVFLDKEEGINITDCEAVNTPLNKLLDEVDPIDQEYIVEVCSTGLGRELNREQHFEVCKGSSINVKLIRPIDNVRDFTGILGEYKSGEFELETESGIISFKVSDCAKINLNDDDI